MHVSGVSGGSQLPSQPSDNWGTMAYSLVAIEELANKAGALAREGAEAVSSAAAIDSDKYQRMYAEVEITALLAEMHLYLSGANRDSAKALAAANAFMALVKKYDFTNSTDPNVRALAVEASKSFVLDANGTVTSFKNQGADFNNWWNPPEGSKGPLPGIVNAYYVLSNIKKDPGFGPNLSEHPKVIIDIAVLYADLLSTPYGKSLNAADFWLPNNDDFAFSNFFPYAMATYAHYMESIGQGNASQMMQDMYALLKEVRPGNGVNMDNFNKMVNEFGLLTAQITSNPNQWPPPKVDGISDKVYNKYITITGGDPSAVYSTILRNLYKNWRNSNI